MLERQEGRCFYSGIPINLFGPHMHWKASLERLCNEDGYTVANCVFVAAEFNTSDHSRNHAVNKVHGTAQWSRDKVQQVLGLRHRTRMVIAPAGCPGGTAAARTSIGTPSKTTREEIR